MQNNATGQRRMPSFHLRAREWVDLPEYNDLPQCTGLYEHQG